MTRRLTPLFLSLVLLAGCDPESHEDPTADAGEPDSGLEPDSGSVAPNCDQRDALCDALTPECPEGQVPSIVAHCFGECVPEASCAPTEPTKVNCDQREAFCERLTPECPEGQVPSIVDHCYGDCVPEASCAPIDPPIDPPGVNCDQRDALCDSTPPVCPDGQVPSVTDGWCWGDCVPVASCAGPVCTYHEGYTYFSQNPSACDELDFACAIDQERFTDECGCGCRPSGDSCGSELCSATELCEVVVSDVPEFDGSYTRERCQPLPTCEGDDLCGCVEREARCEIGSSLHTGTCSISELRGVSLRCDIGG